jgi:hypothetical protein
LRVANGPSTTVVKRPVSIAIAESSACHVSGVGAKAGGCWLGRTSPGTMGEPEEHADAGPRPVAGRINLTPTAD